MTWFIAFLVSGDPSEFFFWFYAVLPIPMIALTVWLGLKMAKREGGMTGRDCLIAAAAVLAVLLFTYVVIIMPFQYPPCDLPGGCTS
jgi:hypothetical protein